MQHLDPELWKRLMEMRVNWEVRRELAEHLSTECEICEKVLDELPQDALDVITDHGLADAARTTPPMYQARAKLMEALSPRPPRWRFVFTGFFVGVAATALVAVVALRTPSPAYSGVKGNPMVELGGLVSAPSPTGERALLPLRPGDKYPSAAELYLTWEIPEPAYVYVGRVSGDDVEPFYPPGAPEKQDPGLHSMSVGGVVHSYSLDGLKGRQRFVLIASDSALTPEELKQALKKEKIDRGRVAGFGLSIEDQR